MNPTFWKRLPVFATGLLIGGAFAAVYVHERIIAAAVKPLLDFQKDIGTFSGPIHFVFQMGNDWKAHDHFPAVVSLMEAQHDNQDRREIQDWTLASDVEDISFPTMKPGQYTVRLDLALCTKKKDSPVCFGQIQYFDFRVGAEGPAKGEIDLTTR